MLLRLTDKTGILRSYLRLRREIKVSTVFLQFQGNDVEGLEFCWNRLYIILIYKFCSWFVSFVIRLKRKRFCIRKVILNYVNYFILNNLIRFVNALNLPKEWIVPLRPFTFPKYGARKIVVIKSSTRVSDNCLICCSHEIAGSPHFARSFMLHLFYKLCKIRYEASKQYHAQWFVAMNFQLFCSPNEENVQRIS